MTQQIVEIDEKQLQKIISKLGPQLYEKAVKNMMAMAADDGRSTMESAIDGGTGVAVRSIVAQSSATTAEIFTMIKKTTGTKIEEGRKPGDAPSLVQIARWQEGSARRRNLDGYSREQFKELKAIQAAIKARGSKAKKYLKGTRDKLQGNLGGYMSRVVEEIKANWRR